MRGICIEGGQSKSSVIVSRANLERTIRRAACYKMNCLELEIYNLAPFASFPDCADADTLSRSDWEGLVELARQHHVTIVPTLQSFGQISEVIWNCDQGKPYRESTVPGLLCPSRPENVKFLQGLYKDLLSDLQDDPLPGSRLQRGLDAMEQAVLPPLPGANPRGRNRMGYLLQACVELRGGRDERREGTASLRAPVDVGR